MGNTVVRPPGGWGILCIIIYSVDVARRNTTNPPVFVRFLLFAILWLVMDGGKPAGLLVGVPAAYLAAWLSGKLLPVGRGGWSVAGLLALVWYFLRNSVVAGVDVAVRVFRPDMRLSPGYAEVDCSFPGGARRDLHLAMGSLLPGSLPVEETESGRVIFHCLDTGQPLAAQMARQEEMLNRALGEPCDA